MAGRLQNRTSVLLADETSFFSLSFLFSANLLLQAQDTVKRPTLLPHHVKIQFAGGIGFFNVGGGYAAKNGKWEGDLFYGYVPKSVGGVQMHVLTAKFTWLPVKELDAKYFLIKPLAVGVLLSYTFGEQYFVLAGKLSVIVLRFSYGVGHRPVFGRTGTSKNHFCKNRFHASAFITSW